MYELNYEARPGQGPNQPETIPTSKDADLADRVAARLLALRNTKTAKLAALATAAAVVEREDHFAGTGARGAGSVRSLATDIAQLERQERYLLAAQAGLTGATLKTDLDRLADVE